MRTASRPALALPLLLLGSCAHQGDAHGAVTIPAPRQAVDGSLPPWNGQVPWPIRTTAPHCPAGARAHGRTVGSSVTVPSLPQIRGASLSPPRF